ncbi:hypothetical protein HPB49_023478 [Dermacentor silvarum]|uniref:Uncharacterized protein n=1 Tax=Dermacentor silvarum TaxID=543639 RepID=A0ACB8E425_DERSI|nr:hypothetical protein HPB49_023478 [Dermacentor silvarum]
MQLYLGSSKALSKSSKMTWRRCASARAQLQAAVLANLKEFLRPEFVKETSHIASDAPVLVNDADGSPRLSLLGGTHRCQRSDAAAVDASSCTCCLETKSTECIAEFHCGLWLGVHHQTTPEGQPLLVCHLHATPPRGVCASCLTLRSLHDAAGGETLPEERKKAVLLSNLGFEGQRLCYDLTSQVDPATLQFQDIIRLLDKHYEDSTNSLIHRIIFRDRRQQPGESFQDFVTSLHRLAPACAFGAWHDESLRDQIL